MINKKCDLVYSLVLRNLTFEGSPMFLGAMERKLLANRLWRPSAFILNYVTM